MLKRLLIANRGEIAVRIIRACREMGIHSIAIYSDSDRDSLHTTLADEAIAIGGTTSRESYLDIKKIISAAQEHRAQAIHPGYGYLSENEEFAKACEKAHIIFIGPTSEVIAQMGNKSVARKLMMNAHVPIIPGSVENLRNARAAEKLAGQLGYPVIIKATAGGGGKGMRIVRHAGELKSAFGNAQREAENAFGNGRVYMEKYIEDARHVEIQVLADNRGNVVHLGERECSIQRRHQKLIEESPSPRIDENMREGMGAVAVRAARAVGYSGAGTIEFVVDGMSYYFLEMNTRVQVEHTVTEMVTGVDIVKEQIRVAGGEPLGFTQEDVTITGHAIECRINAEDPENNFMPSPGTVTAYLPPGGPGVRVDSHLYTGYAIPHVFDSMVAKLVCFAATREECIGRMKRALHEYRIDGIETTIPLHQHILDNDQFVNGDYTTKFIERMFRNERKPSPELSSGPYIPPFIADAHGCFDDDHDS